MVIVVIYEFFVIFLLNILLLSRYKLFFGNAESLDTPAHQGNIETSTEVETNAATFP
jgi:hypothetical protein